MKHQLVPWHSRRLNELVPLFKFAARQKRQVLGVLKIAKQVYVALLLHDGLVDVFKEPAANPVRGLQLSAQFFGVGSSVGILKQLIAKTPMPPKARHSY
jgi:hypothetical protein